MYFLLGEQYIEICSSFTKESLTFLTGTQFGRFRFGLGFKKQGRQTTNHNEDTHLYSHTSRHPWHTFEMCSNEFQPINTDQSVKATAELGYKIVL